jgi:hypothetical protein
MYLRAFRAQRHAFWLICDLLQTDTRQRLCEITASVDAPFLFLLSHPNPFIVLSLPLAYRYFRILPKYGTTQKLRLEPGGTVCRWL